MNQASSWFIFAPFGQTALPETKPLCPPPSFDSGAAGEVQGKWQQLVPHFPRHPLSKASLVLLPRWWGQGTPNLAGKAWISAFWGFPGPAAMVKGPGNP